MSRAQFKPRPFNLHDLGFGLRKEIDGQQASAPLLLSPTPHFDDDSVQCEHLPLRVASFWACLAQQGPFFRHRRSPQCWFYRLGLRSSPRWSRETATGCEEKRILPLEASHLSVSFKRLVCAPALSSDSRGLFFLC